MLPQIDMAHFLTQQVFDDAGLRDFIGSTYFYTSNFIISQKAVGQFSADTTQHFAVLLQQHLDSFQTWTPSSYYRLLMQHIESLNIIEIKVSGSWHKNRDHQFLISHKKGRIPWWSPLLLT